MIYYMLASYIGEVAWSNTIVNGGIHKTRGYAVRFVPTVAPRISTHLRKSEAKTCEILSTL